jgi:hypothetical protein
MTSVTVRRLGAGCAVLLLLAAPPLLLLTLLGSPAQIPAPLRSAHALTSQVDDHTVLWLLGAVVWVLWAHLFGSLALEVLRQTRGSSLRMPLPNLLFGANALLASHLIASLLLTSQSGHGAGHVTGLTPAAARPTAAVTAVAPFVPGRTSQPTVANAAATEAPMVHDNVAATPPTLHASTHLSHLSAGIECRVLPPRGRRHDTLWDIAERHLGDGTRWHDIYALNTGRLMPDGQRLTRASLIRPGWILRLPADAHTLTIDNPGPAGADPHDAAGHSTGSPADGPPDTPATTSPRRSAAGADHTATAAMPPVQHHQDPNNDVPPGTDMDHDSAGGARHHQPAAGPPAPPAQNPAARASAGALPPAASPAAGRPAPGAEPGLAPHEPVGATQVAEGLGTLTVAALGLLAAVTRRRKVAARRRPPGVRPARPAPEVLAAEARLRREARQADVAATIRLALLAAAPQTPQARVKAVWEHPDGGIELVLTEHDPETAAPAPFTATPRGWLLTPHGQHYLFAVRQDGIRRRDRDLRIHHELRAAPDPFPLLLPVGEQDGSACLVNLELFGLISLSRAGTDSAPRAGADRADSSTHPDRLDADGAAATLLTEVMGAWVQALAGAPWAERTRLYIPPAWAELAIGHEDVIAVDLHQPGDAHRPQPLDARDRDDIGQLASHEAARRADAGDVAYDRLEQSIGYQSSDVPEWLLSAAADPLDPNVLLLCDPYPGSQTWQLSADGTLSIPGIADRIRPLRLDPAQHALTLRLLEHAQDPPHAAADDPHRAQLEDACPALPTEPVVDQAAMTEDLPADTSQSASPASQAIDLNPHDIRPDTHAASGDTTPAAPESEQPTPPQPGHHEHSARTAETHPETHGVNHRDDSLPLPRGPVEVGILGPLQICGADGHPPRQQALEILVYLALHQQPVKLKTLAEAIWPNRSYHERTVQNRAGDLRLWLHKERVEKLDAGRWHVTDLVVTDWQRFRALAGGSPAQQLAALSMVRGVPFADLRLDWYHLEGQFAEIEATIVDLTLLVGQRSLKHGDYDTASAASRAGLRGCPYDERLYRLGMQAAAARGATAEVRQLRNQLAWILEEEIEPDDTIQPATTMLYQQLRDQEYLKRRGKQRRSP